MRSMNRDGIARREFMKQAAGISVGASAVGSEARGTLRIADTLRYLMYRECYGETERARELYSRLRAEERGFEGIDLNAAEAACPQGIRIAERLAQARRVLSA